MRIYGVLERFFGWLAEWAEEMRQKVAFCPECGRNRYTGAPCAGGVK